MPGHGSKWLRSYHLAGRGRRIIIGLRLPGALALHSRSFGISSEALSQITKQNQERDFGTISNVVI